MRKFLFPLALLIALAGIVVRNSVVLIDFIHYGIAEGLSIRESVDDLADHAWSWWTPRQQLFDANVRVCVLGFRRPSTGSPPPFAWTRVVTDRLDVPALDPAALSTSGSIGDRADLNANFRDEYYALVPAVADDARPRHVEAEAALEEAGLAVRRVNKVLEGRPHIVDMIKNDNIDLIVNTTEGKQAIADSYTIRGAALQHKVPYSTTIAHAFATSLALGFIDSPAIHRLQDLHQEQVA